MTWIEHRSTQTCSISHPDYPAPHEFRRQPELGVCPYTLSPDERATGLRSSESSRPCPDDCCPPQIRRSMVGVALVRRNPYPQVDISPDVRHRRRSPAPSGQFVRKL